MAKENWPDWEVYKRDRCTCQYCDASGIGNFNVWKNLSIDHVMPKGSGGPDEPENKVVCCKRCNELLGAQVPEGKTHNERIAYKKRYLAKKIAEDLADHEQMIKELLPVLWPAE